MVLAVVLLGATVGSASASPIKTGSAAAAFTTRQGDGVWEASLEGVHGTSSDVTVRELARVSVTVTQVRARLGILSAQRRCRSRMRGSGVRSCRASHGSSRSNTRDVRRAGDGVNRAGHRGHE